MTKKNNGDNMNIFYIYEWYNTKTNEVFYVGKGSKERYKTTDGRNQYFLNYYNKYKEFCEVRFIQKNIPEDVAFILEECRISELKEIGQAMCNLSDGGEGSTFDNLGEYGKDIYYAMLSLRKANGSSQFKLPLYKEKALIECMDDYNIDSHKDVFTMSDDDKKSFYYDYIMMSEEEEDNMSGYKMFCDVILDCFDSMEEYWESVI